MNRRKKGGNSSKAPALTKPAATSAPTATPNPVTASAMPTRVSPHPKVTAPPQAVPPPPKATQSASRVVTQPPRPTASPPKPPMPSAPPARTAAPPTKPGPSQKRVLTRSDRVRMEWMQFDDSWVKPRQAEVEKQLEQLLETAEKNSRVKGKALEQSKDRIVNSMQHDFAMAARVEWERRLEKAGLQAEDWSDITPEEMFAVEQVLSCDETEDNQGAFALAQQRESTVHALSSRTIVEDSPPMPSQVFAGRATPSAASQKNPQHTSQAAPQVGKSHPAWAAWAESGPRHVTVTEVEEEAPKPMSGWGSKNGSIIEELRAAPKAPQVPQPSAQASQQIPRAVQSAPKPSVSPPSPPAHNLLTYPVPLALNMAPLNAAESADSGFTRLIDNAYFNSIQKFHEEAAKADIALAKELRRMMSASERDWTIRAHMVTMEQSARKIVESRDASILVLRRQRFGHDKSDGAAPVSSKITPAQRPPGAFPDESIRVAAAPAPESEPEVEVEREPEPDVDEVIEIPLKGKAAKKKAKKVAEAKAATNGRSTPTPSTPANTRTATPAAKAAPVAEKKPVPATSAWGAAKVSVPARSASPAPPNNKVAVAPTTNGRGTPLPAGMSPWEAAQAKAHASSTPAEPKPPSPPNGMWAPPVARVTSNKNPYAPTRPSRLAQVSEPESPEPPSPPPTREPTGKDYVAWFAGSSSEDEGGAEWPDEAGLSEDEDGGDEEEDRDAHQSNSGAFGGILASLAGASPWALFGEGGQPQKERARPASPAPVRGRGPSATPTPATAAAGRYRPDMDMGAGAGAGMGAEWMRWGAGAGAGPGPSSFGAAPSGFGGGSYNFGSGPSGLGGGPRGGGVPGRQWNGEEDNLEDMLELASKTLDRAAMGSGGARNGNGVNMEEAMAMFVTAQKARETLATPVGGRSASAWRR